MCVGELVCVVNDGGDGGGELRWMIAKYLNNYCGLQRCYSFSRCFNIHGSGRWP